MPLPGLLLTTVVAWGGPSAQASGSALPAWMAPSPARQAEPAPPPGPTTGTSTTGTSTTGTSTTGTTTGESATPPTRSPRDYLMQVNARVRYLSIPDTLIDPWYYDIDDPGANPFKRPKVRGWAFGGEFVFDRDAANYVIWAEYLHPKLKEGYWDDVDDIVDHEDGDWVRPDGLGLGLVGFDYMHEFTAVPTGPDQSPVGLSFLFGAGLGVGIIGGGLEYWSYGNPATSADPDCLSTAPAYERKDVCASEGYKRIPRVVPVADLSLAMRLNFADHAHLRIEGGLHDAPFFGTAAGVVF